MMALKILCIVLIIFLILFLLSLIIYFFNLDMKAAALVMPLMEKYYDWQAGKREKKTQDGRNVD